jgi:hypothetical protein
MKPTKLYQCMTFVTCVLFLAADAARDPKAEEICKAMMQAMGGEKAWNSAHYIRYDFKVLKDGQPKLERSHLWDKWGGSTE